MTDYILMHKPPKKILLDPGSSGRELQEVTEFCIYWRVASDPSSTKTAEAPNVQLDNEGMV